MAFSLPLVAALVVGVLTVEAFLGDSFAADVAPAKVCGNKINLPICSDLPSPRLVPPSSSRLQDPGSTDPPSPTSAAASPSVQAATGIADLHYKRHSYIRRCIDDLVFPLILTRSSSFNLRRRQYKHLSVGSVCLFEGSVDPLQPLLCTAFHPAVASTAFRRQGRRRPPLCSSCCSYPVVGLSCNSVLFGGLPYQISCLI